MIHPSFGTAASSQSLCAKYTSQDMWNQPRGVEVGEFCGGCFQQVTPNMTSQLRLSKAVFCKSCGRLLYLPDAK
jgi:predicted  nucleic acid-binding Zn-ribbon protein